MKSTKVFTIMAGFMLSFGIFMQTDMAVRAEEQNTQIYNETCETTIITTGSLKVRSGPGTDTDIIGYVDKGTVATVTGQVDDRWISVNFEDGSGYISTKYVEIQSQTEAQPAEPVDNQPQTTQATDADRQLLAALIQCEAGGEPYDGQVAVGAVVMNRIKSTAFPNDIRSVIYDTGQFGPVANGKLEKLLASGNINQSCIQAAEEALSGVSNIGDRMYFNRYNGSKGLVIGNHRFR